MGFAEEMTNLGEQFADSFNDRMNFIGKNIAECHRFRNETQKFMRHLKNNRHQMARKLHHELRQFTDNLTETTDHQMDKFRKARRALHNEFKQGHLAFQRMAKTMASKRRNFFGTVMGKAKQEFKRTSKKRH